MKYTYTEEQLREIVSSSYSIAECLKKIKKRGKNMLSAQKETFEVESPKFRETLVSNNDGNPEPSYSNIEGAET